MARILSVVWYKILPARFGGQKGISEFNEYLSQYHELVCICSGNNEPLGTENYKVVPVLPVSKSQLVSFFAWRKIIQAAKQFGSTHILLEHPYYGLSGIFLKKFYGCKLIVHSHNIESQRFREMSHWWWRGLEWLERTTHQYADLNLFKTIDDLLFAVSHFSLREEKCMVVPFGVTRNKIPSLYEKQEGKGKVAFRHKLNPGEKILLFNGTLDYAPNAKAVDLILEKIIPTLLKKTGELFKVITCGRIMDPAFRYLERLQHERFLYAGLVDDISEYFLAADLFINPVLEGGGVKVKVMEALSYNLNVVSTVSGAKGIDTKFCGNKLITVDDNKWEQFCDSIISAWNVETDLPSQFFEEYHWNNVIKKVAEKIDLL